MRRNPASFVIHFIVVLKRAGFSVVVVSLLIAASSVAACGEILDTDEAEPIPATPNDAGQTTTPPSGEDGGPSKVDGGVPKNCTATTFITTADTCLPINVNSCAGAISYGGTDFCNINSESVMLLRFELGPAEADALRGGQVDKISLNLTSHPNCSGCGGGIKPSAGNLVAHVLSNDWVEGTETTNYSGADSCRRSSGNPGRGWGTPRNASKAPATTIASPADYSAQVGEGVIESANVSNVAVALNPVVVKDAWPTYVATNPNYLSILVRRGASGGLVAASRESTLDKAKLTITVCE